MPSATNLVGLGINPFQATALAGPIVTKTDTSLTMDNNYDNFWLRMNNSGAITITLPLNSTRAIEPGFSCVIEQMGAGQVTISAAGGVTLNANPGAKTNGASAVCGLTKVGVNEWTAYGNLST